MPGRGRRRTGQGTGRPTGPRWRLPRRGNPPPPDHGTRPATGQNPASTPSGGTDGGGNGEGKERIVPQNDIWHRPPTWTNTPPPTSDAGASAPDAGTEHHQPPPPRPRLLARTQVRRARTPAGALQDTTKRRRRKSPRPPGEEKHCTRLRARNSHFMRQTGPTKRRMQSRARNCWTHRTRTEHQAPPRIPEPFKERRTPPTRLGPDPRAMVDLHMAGCTPYRRAAPRRAMGILPRPRFQPYPSPGPRGLRRGDGPHG